MILFPDFILVAMAVTDTRMFTVYVVDAEKGVIYEWPTLRRVSNIGFKLTNTEGQEYPLILSYSEVMDGIVVPGNSMGPTMLCTTARFSGVSGISNGLMVMDMGFYLKITAVSPGCGTYDTWFLYDGISKEITKMFQGSVKESVSDQYREQQYDGCYEDVWAPRSGSIERLLTTEGMIWYKLREYVHMKR